jgi:hypothetical protein
LLLFLIHSILHQHYISASFMHDIASNAGLVSFFDFIVGANEKMLLGSGENLIEGEEYDDMDFPQLLKDAFSNKTYVTLLVWNIKLQDKRVVKLYPRNDWGGAGLLGVTIKLDDYGGADERLVRVLEIDSNSKDSPALLAGLIPMDDFLLGTTATTLNSTDVLAGVLQIHLNQIVELYVYNSKTDLVRIVTLHPTYNWGEGYSMLGAAIGTGYLHRLPQSCRSTIGKSVERKVSIVDKGSSSGIGGGNEMNLSQDDIKIEPTLEMEVDDDELDHDVGLASNRRERTRQPHQLGMKTPEREMDDSMRSISLVSAASELIAPPPDEAFQPLQQQSEKKEEPEGRSQQTPPPSQQERPDPPSSAERIELAVAATAAAAAQQQQQGPTPVKKIPSFTDAILNFVAPIPDADASANADKTTATSSSGPPTAVPVAVSELLLPPPPPSEVADTAAVAAAAAAAQVFDSPPPSTQTKTFVVEQPIVSVRPSTPPPLEETKKFTAALFDSPPPQQPKVMDQLTATSLPSFPSAAPVAVAANPLPPSPPPQQLPPPPTITGSAPPPPPPAQMGTPPPPPPPPPSPPAASPDPPSKHNDDDDYEDDDGSEYTDGSYTDDEYTDGEESPIKDKKTTGFLTSLMPAPPKMEY